jgi:beta-mannosidase
VDDSDWVYRCRFEWSPAPGCPNRVLLFEGLDTVCSVSLNGDLIAQSDNMFLPLEVDVTSLLRASNELRIEFSSAVRVANERRSRYLAQEGIAPSLTTFYEG